MVAYVRSGNKYTMAGIPDGLYGIYVATGDGWDEETHTFTSHASLMRWDEPLGFHAPKDQYLIWEITLHDVEGGDAVTVPVAEEDFPAFE